MDKSMPPIQPGVQQHLYVIRKKLRLIGFVQQQKKVNYPAYYKPTSALQ